MIRELALMVFYLFYQHVIRLIDFRIIEPFDLIAQIGIEFLFWKLQDSFEREISCGCWVGEVTFKLIKNLIRMIM